MRPRLITATKLTRQRQGFPYGGKIGRGENETVDEVHDEACYEDIETWTAVVIFGIPIPASPHLRFSTLLPRFLNNQKLIGLNGAWKN